MEYRAETKITQIVPNTTSHVAAFLDENKNVTYEPIICWGLTYAGFIEGYVFEEGTGIVNAEDYDSFLRYQSRY